MRCYSRSSKDSTAIKPKFSTVPVIPHHLNTAAINLSFKILYRTRYSYTVTSTAGLKSDSMVNLHPSLRSHRVEYDIFVTPFFTLHLVTVIFPISSCTSDVGPAAWDTPTRDKNDADRRKVQTAHRDSPLSGTRQARFLQLALLDARIDRLWECSPQPSRHSASGAFPPGVCGRQAQLCPRTPRRPPLESGSPSALSCAGLYAS